MKRIALVGFLIWSFFISNAQINLEAGLGLGASYYNGDINPTKQFYSVSPAANVFFRYNIDQHLSARIAVNYLSASASDLDFDDPLQQSRGASFSTSLMSVDFLLEFGFLPYQNSGFVRRNNDRFTPYVFGGVGANYFFNSLGFSNPVSFPFGFGVKYNIFDRLTAGAEWRFYKTLNDEIDGVVNVSDDSHIPLIHNDDWLNFCGLVISYRINKDKIDCPAYSE